MNTRAFTLTVAIAGATMAFGAIIGSTWSIARLNARVGQVEQFAVVQHHLDDIQDQINVEQDKWDELATDRLQDIVEGKQL